MSNDNNAPFVSTANYAAATGVSTSPFTDQRAVIEGGGGGGGAGNMVYENSSINVDDGSGTVKITTVDQGEDDFNIGTASAKISFDVFDGPDPADPSIQAITASCNGNIDIQSNQNVTASALNNITLAAATGNVSASAGGDMTLTTVGDFFLTSDSALTVVSEEFVMSTADAQLECVTITVTSGDFGVLSGTTNIQASANIVLSSLDGDIEATADGTLSLAATTGGIRMSAVDINFDAGGVNPTYQFRNGEYYRFNGTPQSQDQILTMTGGLGTVASPWLLEWTDTPVTYDEINFTFNRTVLNVKTPITTYNWGNGNGVTFSLNGTNTSQPIYCRWTNNPGATSGVEILRHFGDPTQDGSIANPFTLTWQIETAPPTITDLEINYDTASSILVLSDPNLPPASQIISTTSVVPGRTILIDDVQIAGTSEISCIGLSNSVFPPLAIPQLVGNNPPLVAFPNALGETSWFPGASFRATIAGTIGNLDFIDQAIFRVYSNRGLATQNVLNTFTNEFTGVSGLFSLGWKWTVNFTCRSINNGGVLGVIATNSEFSYTDGAFLSEPYGFIVSNVNSSFDTSVTQHLDFTIDFIQSGNSLTTNLFTIERIF